MFAYHVYTLPVLECVLYSSAQSVSEYGTYRYAVMIYVYAWNFFTWLDKGQSFLKIVLILFAIE